MNMRTFVISGLSLAILAGCGGPSTVSYRLEFDTEDPETITSLVDTTVRVAERRLDRLDAQLFGKHTTEEEDGSVVLELTVSSAEAADTLSDELSAPFDLQIMRESIGTEPADVIVEGFGAFTKTGVTGEDLVSVEAAANPDRDGGMVSIYFTEAGKTKMAALFKEYVGKNLGLFVREKLVSGLTIVNETLPDPLVIDGIPDFELASIFADDVNVGLHVTVTPL